MQMEYHVSYNVISSCFFYARAINYIIVISILGIHSFAIKQCSALKLFSSSWHLTSTRIRESFRTKIVIQTP